jgi:guanylate kinase
MNGSTPPRTDALLAGTATPGKGLLFVVTAPSGAGKSSLIKALLRDDPSLRLSVSYTTRAPRPGEEDGREYHFTTETAFLAMRSRGEFLECAEVHGNRYGTSARVIADALERGVDLLLEIDWQGANQVRALHPDCVRIFILPPSLDELERRLRARAQDSEESIRRRMANAADELSHAREFDYAIINKDFETASADLKAVIRTSRLSLPVQFARNPNLFQD